MGTSGSRPGRTWVRRVLRRTPGRRWRVLGGGLALLGDPCFTPVWIGLLVIGVAATAVWIVRARNKSGCGDDGACRCTPDSEVDLTHPATAQPRP